MDQDLPSKIIKVIFLSALFSNARLKTVLCQRALFCQGWSFVRKGSPFSFSFIRLGGLLSRKLVLSLGLCPGPWSLLGKLAFVRVSLSGKVVLVREDGHLSRVVSHQGL